MDLRPYLPADRDFCLGLLDSNTPRFFDPGERRRFEEFLDQQNCSYFVMEHDGAIDIPPGDKDFLVSDEVTIPMDLNVLAVYPHAHYLAKLMEGYATLPDGSRKSLIKLYYKNTVR